MSDRTPRSRTLSTGHEVAVPLETEAEATAVAVTADAGAVAGRLPGGLAPVRIAPGRAAVALLSVDYRRIGDDAMAPYEEFGVLLAATPEDGPVPELAALRSGFSGSTGALGGYVAALPVTTEPARALGVEIWGYPKSVADVRITDRGDRRRTAVGDERGHALTLEAPFRPRLRATVETASYTGEAGIAGGPGSETGPHTETGAGGALRYQPLELSGRFGARPFGGAYSLGRHPLGERLRGLELGRTLGAVAFDGTFVIGEGRPL
ncbi:acetoacetate decarboxylase family protein [Halosimplex pelagicum]|uniref:Acetoacetate decarboxylase family protein n=1 Tax=Halosimplex pelagicum TaxID=869886 RepID=A0A7D5P9Q8_9EURY|nr:acetoacetate decarboxylase family protein [Halosimplex pelagicum]QLH80678.1 acetoacetate decarboxylase family protein [Halosimplex pelagicum]